MTSRRPLEGLLVVAIEQAVAAPLATCRLADAGARVIKVERDGGDFATGIYAYSAILEALIERGLTGAGRNVEVSLFHTMADWMAVPLLRFEQDGLDWPRVGLGHPTIVPYGLFQLGDGSSVLIGVQNDREFVRLCNEVLEQPHLAEAYPRNVDRAEGRAAIEATIGEVFMRHDRQSIRTVLDRARIAYGFLNDIAALSRHPQLRRARQPLPDGTEIDMVAPAAAPNEPGRRLRRVDGGRQRR